VTGAVLGGKQCGTSFLKFLRVRDGFKSCGCGAEPSPESFQ